ncbi:MAG: molybdate ABC transporter substrate-binding protein [Campylobacteraceae bacterium]
MRKLLVGFLVAIMATLSLAAELNLAVAANVQNAFPELEKAFNKIYPDIKLNPSFGESGNFRTQIKNGAPYDIFLSADMKFAQEIFDASMAVKEPAVYAEGALAMFSAKKLDLSKGLDILKDSSVKKISIANPDTAPYGKASVEAITNAKLYDEVKSKLVQAESIGQVVAQVTTAADIGFPAKSAFYTDKMAQYKEGVNWISVDPKLYNPISQGVVVIKNAKNSDEALKFYNFILSDEGKKIFVAFGYNVP